MNDAAYERWLSQFVEFGGEMLTKEEWAHHPNNPNRKRRGRHRPADRQIVQMYPRVAPRRDSI